MNETVSSPNMLLPAAERAMRMEESLDQLEALVMTQLSGVPLLVRLLMQFFAMLRAALDRLAEGKVVLVAPAADVVVPTDEVVAAGVARTLGPRMPRVACTRQARTLTYVGKIVRVEPARHPWRERAAKLEASWNNAHFRKKFQKSTLMFVSTHAHFIKIT